MKTDTRSGCGLGTRLEPIRVQDLGTPLPLVTSELEVGPHLTSRPADQAGAAPMHTAHFTDEVSKNLRSAWLQNHTLLIAIQKATP